VPATSSPAAPGRQWVYVHVAKRLHPHPQVPDDERRAADVRALVIVGERWRVVFVEGLVRGRDVDLGRRVPGRPDAERVASRERPPPEMKALCTRAASTAQSQQA